MTRHQCVVGLGGLTAVVCVGCAPLVRLDPPSPDGPRIERLEFAPARAAAGCPVLLRFHFDSPTADPVRVAGASVFGRGRRTIVDDRALASAADVFNGRRTGEVEIPVVPERSGRYWYLVQVEDRQGRKSNVLEASLGVDFKPDSVPEGCPS